MFLDLVRSEMVVLLRRKGTMSFSLMATRIRALMAEKTGTETDWNLSYGP